ncbi:MAG TPA: hypothetical protein VGR78_10210 [Verrucomicrobiae bacterium]|nr:hypothetical protein [Verrucomicrobiae bacterium]
MKTPFIMGAYPSNRFICSFLGLLIFFASPFWLSLLAQNPPPNATNIDTEEGVPTPFSGPPIAANLARSAVSILDIITQPPAPAGEDTEPPPAWMPPVISNYLPTTDTNVGIGIWYRPGDRRFVYLVAGIRPPEGDPNLPPTEEEIAAREAALVPAFIPPPVTYYRAGKWSRAVNTREVESEIVRDLPPGARRSVVAMAGTFSAQQPSGPGFRVPYPERTTTDTGEDFVQNFPPGATVMRNLPPTAPKATP